MSSLRVLRRRIRSVQNTQQITKAMEMVAAAKLRRAQSRAQAARPYASKITEMLENLAGAAGEIDHPLFKAREVKTTALVLVTADRGLCGSYNANLVRGAEQRLRNSPTGVIQLVLVGKKGRDYFKRRRHAVRGAGRLAGRRALGAHDRHGLGAQERGRAAGSIGAAPQPAAAGGHHQGAARDRGWRRGAQRMIPSRTNEASHEAVEE